eukprot:7385763-Prymnesium_polylepis.1
MDERLAVCGQQEFGQLLCGQQTACLPDATEQLLERVVLVQTARVVGIVRGARARARSAEPRNRLGTRGGGGGGVGTLCDTCWRLRRIARRAATHASSAANALVGCRWDQEWQRIAAARAAQDPSTKCGPATSRTDHTTLAGV